MSNPHLMASLAGISAGLGKAPAKKLTGAAKHFAHIKNLDPAERDSARAIYKAMQDKLKAEREAAVADFYKKFPGAIPIEQRKIDTVVNAFVAGASAAHGQVETDGLTLTVSGRSVAARKNASDRFITVCPGFFGTAKVDRYTANAALRVLGAGIKVNDVRETIQKEGGAIIGGDHQGAFLAPRGSSRGRILFDAPDACMRVEVNQPLRQKALRNAYGADQIGPMQVVSRDTLPGEKPKTAAQKRKEKKAREEATGKLLKSEKARYRKYAKGKKAKKKVSAAQKKLKASIKAKDKSRYARSKPYSF